MKRIIVASLILAYMSAHAAQQSEALTEEHQMALYQGLLDAGDSDNVTEDQVKELLAQGVKFRRRNRYHNIDPLVRAIDHANFHVLRALQPEPLVKESARELQFDRSPSYWDTWHAAHIVSLLHSNHTAGCRNQKKVETVDDVEDCHPDCFWRRGIRRYGSKENLREKALDAMDYLLRQKADASICILLDEIPPLVFAARKNDLEICALLLRHGADVKKKSREMVGVKLDFVEESFESMAARDKNLQEFYEEQPLNPHRRAAVNVLLSGLLPQGVVKIINEKI